VTHDDRAIADTAEHDAADAGTDWEAAYSGEVPDTPVDSDVVALANDLGPGTALDLGCGSGQNSIWLAQRGWRVHGVDIAANAIRRAEQAAAEAGVEAAFEAADVTTWRTTERFDLVISTYALPPRGHGRSHALTVARDAVAPGGRALIAEFESSLADSGWMARENLVELDEVTAMFPGFHLDRAEVRVTAHSHGSDHKELPIVIVIARHHGPRSSEA
jgi:cyclopropane fatty-acyl-phospholipid synthase-like methyltransferase